MAPGSAVTATARFKLLSLASFGLISGACIFVGCYLLWRYGKKSGHRDTDAASEEKLTTNSDETSKTDDVFDQPDSQPVAYKTSEEKQTEKEEEEKEEGKEEKEEEAVPAKQANTITQNESSLGNLGTSEQGSSTAEFRPIVTDSSFLFDNSRAIITGAGLATENRHPTAEGEWSREEKEATAAETAVQESGSKPTHVISTKEIQTTRNEDEMANEDELKSETSKVVKAEATVAEEPLGAQRNNSKLAESTAYKESRSETIQGIKTFEGNKENEQQSVTIEHTRHFNTGDEPKSEAVLETKSPEPTVQKPCLSNENDTKTAVETDGKEQIQETNKNAQITSAAPVANERQSAKLKNIKTTEVTSRKEQISETSDDANIAETTSTEEPRRGRKDAKSPETAADKEHKTEVPRSTKSHIPEPIKRLADNRPDTSHEPATTRKADAELPVASPTKDDTEQPGFQESKHNEGKLVKPPLNRNATETDSFRPQRLQLHDARAHEAPSLDENKYDQTKETSIFAAKKMDSSTDCAISSPNCSPGHEVCATGDHVTEADDSSPLIARSTKSLIPPLPLTPPPGDSKKQSRRHRERGTQGPSMTVELAASEGLAIENQSSRSRHRWPPLEDKTLDNVEVDMSSQQVLWKTDKKELDSAQPNTPSPWASPHAVQDETSSGEARRRIEFEDNFVGPVSTKVPTSSQDSELTVPIDVTKQSALLNATPDCVLERKPLISDDEEDVADNEDEGRPKKQLASKNSTKNGTEVTAGPTLESNSSEATVKLVEIHQNCVGSLIGLTGKEVDRDVRLASLRALVNQSWTSEKHLEYTPVIDQLCSNLDSEDASLQLESIRVLVNLSKNPAMVPYILAAKAPNCLLKLLVPEVNEEVLVNWLTILDDILWTSKEMCLTYASLPMDHRAASPETVYTGLYGLKNSRVLKSRIFVLSRNKSQQVTYLSSRIYSCLTS